MNLKHTRTEIFITYNNIKNQYNTALSQASAGRQWSNIEAQRTFAINKMLTVGDSRVRDKHIPLDGVYPVEHPFWNENFPANDWVPLHY
jgi:hypothetical protein